MIKDWKNIDSAPTCGEVIVGLYEEGESLIFWSDDRT